ncbi:MAG: AEC family transporter [Anaerovoracaceae bacterium]|jgi:predicted permease
MNMETIITQMSILFTIILLGYIIKKVGIIDEEGDKKISVLLLMVTLPALTMASVMVDEKTLSNQEVGLLFGLAGLMYLFLIGAAFILPKLLAVQEKDVGLFRFMTIFSNIGFMGFPVVRAIFGNEAVFYAAIFNIPFNLLSFTLGIYLITDGKGKGKLDYKFLLHPGIISSILSVIIYLSNISIPKPVVQVFTMVGDVTIPLSMIITGSALAILPIKEVFSDVRIYIFSLIKLLPLPVIFWWILRWFVVNQDILGVSTIMVSMPVAAAASMFATAYDGNKELASKGIFISTLMSLGTIPFIMWLLFIR